MDVSYNVVFKVSYGIDLRRFNARIVDGEVDLSMNGLREKINVLFGFANDVELMLTYIDEDCDVVALVDDDDLRDAVRQRLNPIRISVKKLKSRKGSKVSYSSSGSSTTRQRSSQKKETLQNLNDSIAEVTKALPEAAREALNVMFAAFTSKAPGAAPDATEGINGFAKLGLSSLVQPSETRAEKEHGSSSSGVATDSGKSGLNTTNGKEGKSLRNDENVWKVPTETTKGKEKAEIVTDSEGTSSEKAPESTAAPPSLFDCRKYGFNKEKLKKDEFKNVGGCCANKEPHMLVRKLAGSYTVLPSGTQPGMVSDNIDKPTPVEESNHCGGMGYVAPVGLYGYPSSTWSPPAVGLYGYPSSMWSPPAVGLYGYLGSIWSPPPVDLNRAASISMYGHPFSGVSFGSTSASSQLPSPMIQPQRSYGQDDGSGLSLHHGVQCDGCGFYPIIGPRYKSKVRMDYDLCTFCFPQIGNETDYIKMELPAVYPHLTPSQQMSDPTAVVQQHSSKNFEDKSDAFKLDSCFIRDVSIMDGTVMAPLTPFTKIWQMKNNGTTVWPEGTRLIWIGGDKFCDQSSVEVAVPAGGLLVDQELHVSVDFTAPEIPGGYISHWRLVSPSGQRFGQRVWALIQIPEGIEPDTFQLSNFILPPTTASPSSVVETANVNAEPIPEGGSTETFDKMAELVRTLTSSLPEDNQETKLPDTSLVSDDPFTSAYPTKTSLPPPAIATAPEFEQQIDAGSSELQAMGSEKPNLVSSTTDASFPEPIVEPSYSPPPISTSRASVPELGADTEKDEARLLWEIEQMGFDRVDHNKEFRRMYGYDDSERAVEELGGLSEWDPIIDELEEMGFHDTEMNKALLKKNGGSIKRVVMDLIAGGEDDN